MTIAVAKDEAFNFTYRSCIDSLKALGEVIFFSPLRDKNLPACDLLYLPGGYPELYASELDANKSMRLSIKAFGESNGKIFAECGGFMYLCQDIDQHKMCGIFPFSATMDNARLHLGYRQTMIHGHCMKGHEFHYSALKECSLNPHIRQENRQLSATGKPVDTAIYYYKNVIAGYTHWYWAETGILTFWT